MPAIEAKKLKIPGIKLSSQQIIPKLREAAALLA